MRMEKKRFDEGERSFLCKEKIAAMEEIGFVWAKQKGSTLWEEKFADLKRYYNQHGHCNVPTKYKKDTALGRWVSTQRKQYKDMKDNKRSLMTQEKIERLEALGFRWTLGQHEDPDSESSSTSSIDKSNDMPNGYTI